MFKYHFTIAVTTGGTFHIKIRFAKRERNWPPSNRPQSVGLVGVQSSAQHREQINPFSPSCPGRWLCPPRSRGAAAGQCPLVAGLAWSRGCKESLMCRKFLGNAMFVLSRTGSCLLWAPQIGEGGRKEGITGSCVSTLR